MALADDISKAIHYPDCWDTAAYPTLAHALWEMVDVEGYLCPTCDKEQGMRGLLEKKEVLYIRPAPGTCCPEMNIKKGVCLGCGTKKKKEVKKNGR